MNYEIIVPSFSYCPRNFLTKLRKMSRSHNGSTVTFNQKCFLTISLCACGKRNVTFISLASVQCYRNINKIDYQILYISKPDADLCFKTC